MAELRAAPGAFHQAAEAAGELKKCNASGLAAEKKHETLGRLIQLGRMLI